MRLTFSRILLFLSCSALISCTGETVQRSNISGKVTFKNAPVPAGTIYFTPDPVKNPGGTQATATIVAGEYDTAKDGRGSAGGAVVVRIEGFDGKGNEDQPLGRLLFMHEEKLDLPKEGAKRDFVIPDGAGKNLTSKQEPV